MTAIPDGFEIMPWPSPFIHHAGPVYLRQDEDGAAVFGLLIQERHLNRHGTAHGAALLLLADVALGYGAVYAQDSPAPVATASLTTDFASAAHLGDWVEARVDVQKVGSRLAFANVFLSVGEERVARASAVFALSNNPL